jgi:formate-dependent nitrite reductase membrane component NrfD
VKSNIGVDFQVTHQRGGLAVDGLQTTWGWLVAVYLFLGGLGAGCFVATAMVALTTGERFKATVRFGAWLSAITIAAGVLVLLLDVGKPFRAIVLFNSFGNLNSWMALGAWLLFGAILFNGLFALFWTEPVLKWVGGRVKLLEEKRKVFRAILAVIGIPVNVGVAIYTGVLLGVLPFRPFWHTWLLPALFTASALSTGSVCLAAYEHLRDGGKRVNGLVRAIGAFHLTLILVEVGIWVYYLRTMLNGAPDMASSARILVSGALAPVFWIVVIGLGLAIPFLVHTMQLSRVVKLPQVIFVLSIVTALVGGWTLRFVVLSAGLPSSLASPAFSQALEGVRFMVK